MPEETVRPRSWCVPTWRGGSWLDFPGDLHDALQLSKPPPPFAQGVEDAGNRSAFSNFLMEDTSEGNNTLEDWGVYIEDIVNPETRP